MSTQIRTLPIENINNPTNIGLMKVCKIFMFLAFLLVITNNTYSQSIATSPSRFITDMVVTPQKLIAGELDTRLWNNPYNGVYVSSDAGISWIKVGLEGRGITKLSFNNNSLYAATYYSKNNTNGIFRYRFDTGEWEHLGPNFSVNTVEIYSGTLIAGTPSQGLWISNDSGKSWIQKIGFEGTDNNIQNITVVADKIYAFSPNKVYESTDKADTWTENSDYSSKGFRHLKDLNDTVYACAGGKNGFYISYDSGKTWKQQALADRFECQFLFATKDMLYVGISDESDQTSKIFSWDMNTWKQLNTNIHYSYKIRSIQKIYTEKTIISAVIASNGITYLEENPYLDKESIFELPWQTTNPTSQITDKITAYFDHEFPLLGYIYKQEPIDKSYTTTNFFGEKQPIPKTYYSTHNGIDFAAEFGSDVTAVQEGIASYYYCQDCGNSIKIKHPDAYETVYMHLQNEDLVTKDKPVFVYKNQKIGRVGMTGKTSGPHIHFGVMHDNNKNGNFDYPDEMVDPYGWLATYKDPWENYEWADYLGNHNGSHSRYLWSTDITQKAVTGTNVSIEFMNKSVGLFDLENAITLKLFQDIPPLDTKGRRYVPNTAFSLVSYDLLNNSISFFDIPLEIRINLSDEDLSYFVKNSLKIFFYDPIANEWIPLETSIFDKATNTVSSKTQHLSKFAVLGNIIDTISPNTEININGASEYGWYKSQAYVSLSVVDNLDKNPITFYSLNNDFDWSEYVSPIQIINNGVSIVYFKSQDKTGNLELTKYAVVKVDSENSLKKASVFIKNVTFSINNILTNDPAPQY